MKLDQITYEKEGERMPIWKCTKCGEEVEGRCRPQKCPKCEAPKDSFKKKE